MKKFHLYLWIIALVGMITSCSQDETDTLTANESNRVSFTASLPADFAKPGTRALPTAPANLKLRCVLEVWSSDLSTLIVRKEELVKDGAIKFDFSLETPDTYKALLWADYIPEGGSGTAMTTPNEYTHYTDYIYKTGENNKGLKAVTQTGNGNGNPGEPDAFFAAKDFTKGTGH